MRLHFWLKPLSLAVSRRLYVYGAAMPAAVLLLAVAVLFIMHGSMMWHWRLAVTALASVLMLSCVGWVMVNGHRYELRVSLLWAAVSLTALGWAYVEYGQGILRIESRLHEQARVQSIDTCARHFHISHPACQALLKTRSGRVLDTDDVIYHLQTRQKPSRPG